MYTPSRSEAREFFFTAWAKYRAAAPLTDLERIVVEIVTLHPEYHALLESRERNLDADFTPDGGQLNPFLHLSLHLGLAEQIAVLEKKIQELKTRGDKPPPDVVASEVKVTEAKEELEKANKALEQATAEQTAKESEVERLKVEAAKAPPPPNIDLQLASAREVRGKAREDFTNATQAARVRTSALTRASPS